MVRRVSCVFGEVRDAEYVTSFQLMGGGLSCDSHVRTMDDGDLMICMNAGILVGIPVGMHGQDEGDGGEVGLW